MPFEWHSVGDLICQLLHKVYVENSRFFAREARALGIPKESLAAAAICGMLSELAEGKAATEDPMLN
jgi:hypothetical protein